MASKKNMSDYKILTRKLYPSPKRVQELIPIFKIGVDGVFQLEDLPDGRLRMNVMKQTSEGMRVLREEGCSEEYEELPERLAQSILREAE